MQLKTELQDLLFMSNEELREIEQTVNPPLNALRDRLGWEEFNKLENAVNRAMWEACMLGFRVGFAFAQDPAAFIFEPDLSDRNVERTAADLLNQVGD